jgi:SpoVK/Ycf46/Vps4 family AAA+-type ATPase
MDFTNFDEIKPISGRTLPEVDLIPELKENERIILNTCEYFFKINLVMNSFPFKGFILEGPPGTGKTELIKQVARKLDKRLQNVFFLFIDGASIAAPKWGDAEKRIREVFRYVEKLKTETTNPKLIILFDDIESLMISRGVDLAKEWHYSINSILFHEVDNLNPTNTIVCATTNRVDLVDEAIKTRLYPLKIDTVSIESLLNAVKVILDESIIKEKDKDYVLKKIRDELLKIDRPTLRDARQITVVECIKNGVWSV